MSIRGDFQGIPGDILDAADAALGAVGYDSDPLIMMLACARAIAAERAHGWQPIETAPKDGTWVLAGHRHGGKWVYRLAAFNPAPHMMAWFDMPGRHVSYATHWQPLPSSPVDEELVGRG